MRSRNLKPGYFRNELLAACEPLARLLFAGLWGEADREGRLEDRPQRLKADILPYDPCDIDALLTQLMQRGFITRYVVDGNRYIAIHHFRKHQHPHCKEPPSDIPPPNPQAHEVPSQAPVEHHASTGQAPDEHQCDPADSLLPLTDSLLPLSAMASPSPNARAKKKIARASHTYEPAFLAFWDAYPNRQGKGAAAKAFAKTTGDERRAITVALPDFVGSWKWTFEPRFIPHPATWLNQRRWEDTPPSVHAPVHTAPPKSRQRVAMEHLAHAIHHADLPVYGDAARVVASAVVEPCLLPGRRCHGDDHGDVD